ncbi:hypothetical protein WG8_1782 [Paenibacillus sp. Aloe-11]|nr:hypothetical protein WG8_1782 [Paenibacillus sp. Aloe-11]
MPADNAVPFKLTKLLYEYLLRNPRNTAL